MQEGTDSNSKIHMFESNESLQTEWSILNYLVDNKVISMCSLKIFKNLMYTLITSYIHA